MDNDRVMLSVDEVDAMLLDGEYVHTFTNPANAGLLYADIKRSDLLEMAKAYGAELSGKMATSMKYGVVIYYEKTTMFCETKSSEKNHND